MTNAHWANLEGMDFEELWLLHEELTKILTEKISAEKLELEKRLTQLNPTEPEVRTDRIRRKYPEVLPKYYNPAAPEETWSGRGKRPRWLAAALQSGHDLEDFKITDSEVTARVKPQRGGHL